MLRIIEGGAKTGKSTKIKEELLGLAETEEGESPRLWLFVPEQFSFETERAYAEALEDAPLDPTQREYAEALGAARATRIRVVSFNRFAGDIFREFGGMAGEYATDAARLITMKLALQDCRGELSAYGRAALRPDFPKEMVRAVAELKNAGISADDLDKTAARLGEGPLTEKLADLSLLRSVYDGLLSEHYIDGLDDLGRAALLCAKNSWFAGKRFYLDGFKSFTAVQERIIGLMLSQGAEVTVTLPIGGDDPRFAITRETAKRLRSLAYQAGQPVPGPEILPGPGYFGDPALAHFAGEILKSNPAPFSGENNSVECAALFHEFDEAEFAAARILEYARAEGFAFEEMAVLVRDMNKYGPLLEAAFSRYNIPFYMDRVESVEILPLFRLIAHFLEGAASGRREERLAVLKCGLLPVSLEETAAFESYTYVWNLDRDCLARPFVQHPAGYTDRPMTPAEEEELAGAERVRSLLSGWTEAFLSAYEEEKSWPKALYRALVFLDIPTRVGEKILSLQNAGCQGDSDDWRRSWEVFVELLDVSGVILDKRELPLKDFISLFSASAAGYTLGRVPQTLDSVLVGSAERVRLSGKKAVLVLGANEGEFPLLPSSGGLFTERERQELIRLGLPLSGTDEAALLEERFVAWQALSSPSHRLAVSYSLGNLKGEEKYPSAIVAGFRRIFPQTPIQFPDSFPPEFFCRSPRTAFLQALRRREDPVFSPSVREYLAGEPEYGPRLALLDRRAAEGGFRLESPETAEGLFGGARSMSPTQIEKFYQCRFRYFCEYGLKLRGRGRAELNPLARGSALHYLLHGLLQEESFLTLSQDELWERIQRLLDQYLEETMGGKDQSRRFLYLYRRMAESALRIFRFLQQEFAQSEFAVAGVEEPIGYGQRVLPLRIQVPGPEGEARTISITGQIDRIDTWEKDGETYFRIVDYKSGRKKFDLGAVAQGLNLQMLLYLFAIWRGGRDELANARPAGILYMPIGTVKPSLGRDAGEGERRSSAEKAFAMNGLLLSDNTVLMAMERDLEGRYLPVSRKKDGSLKNSQYLAELQDFENLEWYITRLVRQMEGALLAGEIAADPAEESGRRPCAYCDYRPICGHEDADGFRQAEEATLESIREIRENSEEGEA